MPGLGTRHQNNSTREGRVKEKPREESYRGRGIVVGYGQAPKQYHQGLGVKSQAWCQGIAVVAEPT